MLCAATLALALGSCGSLAREVALTLTDDRSLENDVGCLLALPQNSQYPPGTIVDGNCAFDFELGLPVDEPHCPESLPIAMLLVPKCASTSFLNWLAALDGTTARWAELVTTFDDRVRGECLFGGGAQGCGFDLEDVWQRSIELIHNVSGSVPPRSSAGSRGTFETLEGQAEIQYRFGRRFHDGLLPHPRNCIPCCSGAGRLPIVVLRNPYARLMAYFQRAWLGNEKKELLRMEDFGVWAEALSILAERGVFAQQASEEGGADVEVQVSGRRAIFSREDLYHTRPVRSLLADVWPDAVAQDLEEVLPSCLPEACWFARRVFVVRTELAAEDLHLLSLRLCLARGMLHCAPLPGLARLNARPPGDVEAAQLFWVSMAGTAAARVVAEAYAADFALGQYSRDPGMQLPRQPSARDVFAWVEGAATSRE